MTDELIGDIQIQTLRQYGAGWMTELDAEELLRRDEFLVKRKERLELVLRLLQNERGATACCTVCWSLSWEPCEETDENAIPDPFRTGEFMRCEMCSMIKYSRQMRTDIQEARRLIGLMTNDNIAKGAEILDKYKPASELQS